jgi:hypothetical protein
MEAILYKTERAQMTEVEIYETGEKKLIAISKHIANQKNMPKRSLIITAAEYKSYKADMVNTEV